MSEYSGTKRVKLDTPEDTPAAAHLHQSSSLTSNAVDESGLTQSEPGDVRTGSPAAG